jgi:hypothetical protein
MVASAHEDVIPVDHAMIEAAAKRTAAQFAHHLLSADLDGNPERYFFDHADNKRKTSEGYIVVGAPRIEYGHFTPFKLPQDIRTVRGRDRIDRIFVHPVLIWDPGINELVLGGGTHGLNRAGAASIWVRVNAASPYAKELRDHPANFTRQFATVLLHEFTHVRDFIRAGDVIDPMQHRFDPDQGRAAFAAYVNSPHEVRARQSQVVYEVLYALRDSPAGKLIRRRAELMRDDPNAFLVEEALLRSKTWQRNEGVLTEDNRAKILRAVYRALEREGLLIEQWRPRLPRTKRSVAAEAVARDLVVPFPVKFLSMIPGDTDQTTEPIDVHVYNDGDVVVMRGDVAKKDADATVAIRVVQTYLPAEVWNWYYGQIMAGRSPSDINPEKYELQYVYDEAMVSVPERASVAEEDVRRDSSPEYFASAFLTTVETGHPVVGPHAIEVPDEYLQDPRAAKLARAVRHIGIDKTILLGSGSFGSAAAYARPSPAGVVKLTSDRTEVLASALLKGQKLPHVADVYGAWFVRDVDVERWDASFPVGVRVGLITQQKLQPVDAVEARSITTTWLTLRQQMDLHPDTLAAMPHRDARIKLYDASVELEARLRAIRGYQIASDVADALAELRGLGIYAIDVHGGNIGRDRQGVFKIFDVGSSSSPAGTQAPELGAAEGRGRALEACTCGMVEEDVAVEEIDVREESVSQLTEQGRLERSYDLPDGRTNHQVSMHVDGCRYVVVVTVERTEIVHTEVYEGLLRQPARPSASADKAELRARRIVREHVSVERVEMVTASLTREHRHSAREAPRPVYDEGSSLPFVLVQVKDDVVPALLIVDEGLQDDGVVELMAVDIVDPRLLRFGPESIVGAVNVEPAAVWWGVKAEVDESVGVQRLAAEEPHPSPENRHAKKGDVIIEYPGLRAIKGKPFKVRPRGQRFQWSATKPLGLSAFPEVKPVLLQQRREVPTVETIRMCTIFAGLTVHAGTDEAEETFSMLVRRYESMHGAMPPVEMIQDILARHLPIGRTRMYESAMGWSVLVHEAMKRGLRDRELRRYLWVDVPENETIENVGLAKMSFALMLMGQNVCCLDTWMLGAAFAQKPFDPQAPYEAAIRRREAGDRISKQWGWKPAKSGRELGLKRYEQVEDAIIKDNPFFDAKSPLSYAQCQWTSWEWALGEPAAHRPWLEVVKQLQAKRAIPRPDVPF